MDKLVRFDRCRGCEEKRAEYRIPLKSLGFYIPVCEECINFVISTLSDELRLLKKSDITFFKHPYE